MYSSTGESLCPSKLGAVKLSVLIVLECTSKSQMEKSLGEKSHHAAGEAKCPKRVRETEILRARSKKRHEDAGKTRCGERQEVKEDKSVRRLV